MDEVVGENRLLFVGDTEGEAFAGVEFHFVGGFPKLEGVKIFLELGRIRGGVDGSIQEAVVCE